MKKKRLSNMDFLKLCDEVRNNRETIVKEIHNNQQLADYLIKIVGINVGPSSIPSILEATGTQLDRRDGRSLSNEGKTRNTRILTKTLVQLLDKLGEKIPFDLLELYERSTGKEFVPPVKVPPVPLSTVIDPKTMNVIAGAKQ